jgi:tRNA threonylcarbamoyladenosine biosynthesis protein TsaE
MIIRSPTYTYYQKYDADEKIPVYHFDLYRIEDISGFYSIGGMEIASDRNAIMLIEWPEILGDTIIPTKKISIEIMEDETRKITIT